MNNNIYIAPELRVIYTEFEGFICGSTFDNASVWIDDVVEGQDYGCL